MSEPFVGEIRAVGLSFAPRGWATCDGQVLPISQNSALFSLLGVTYGGNGTSTFGLPNIANRAPMGAGNGPGLSQRQIGDQGGSQTVTLSALQLGQHGHGLTGTSLQGNAPSPNNNTVARTSDGSGLFTGTGNPVQMSLASVGNTGGGAPHNNMQPYLGVTFIIALAGIFPQRP